jgi:homoserine/homoserine lactone efflux protein
MSLKLLLVFAVTEFLLSLTPGLAVLLVFSQGIESGFSPSLRGAAGILTGNAIYFFLCAFGLGTLLLASATLFEIIRWLGIAYLVLTGIRLEERLAPLWAGQILNGKLSASHNECLCREIHSS